MIKKIIIFISFLIFVFVPYTVYLYVNELDWFDYSHVSVKLQSDIINKDQPDMYFEDQYDIVFTGDSSASSTFDPQIITNSINISSWGQSSAEIVYSFKNYLETYQSPKCLVISYRLLTEFYQDSKFWDIYVGAGFFSLAQMHELYNISTKENEFPASGYNRIHYYFKYMLYHNRLIFSQYNAFQKTFFESNRARNEVLLARGIKTYGNLARPTVYNKIVGRDWSKYMKNGFRPGHVNTYYLEELKQIVEKHKIKVIYTSPLTSTTILGPEVSKYIKDVNDFTLKILGEENTLFFKTDNYPDEFFFDDIHLNQKGAKKYSFEIAPYLRKHCSE